MSTWLMIMLPCALLAIAASLCFVGCYNAVLISYGQYEETIINTKGLVAFWPLDDATGTTATDLGPNSFNGIYTQGPNVGYDSTDQSAAAPGVVTIDQPGIVPGDTINNNINAPSPCPYFNGGFVAVPWAAAFNPQPPFTVEAWVRPDWTADDVANFPATRGVVVSVNTPANAGWALSATPDDYWAATVGTGSALVAARPPAGSNQTILLGTTAFLVMTYDGTTLTLWVNPADTSQPPYAQTAVTGFLPVSSTSATRLFIGMGRPDLPTGLFPFNGWIQDVAFYNVVLDGTTIETHYLQGNGMTTT